MGARSEEVPFVEKMSSERGGERGEIQCVEEMSLEREEIRGEEKMCLEREEREELQGVEKMSPESEEKEEIHCVETKSRSDEDILQVLHKETKFAYKRDFLLSLAENDECKRLPSEFDSLILRELDDMVATSLSKSCSISESGGWDGRRWQNSWINPAEGQSLQNPSNGQSWRNPTKGLLGQGSLLSVPEYVAGASAEKIPSYNVLNKSVAPYRPPYIYKMNLHLERDNKGTKSGEPIGFSDPNHGRAKVERSRRDSSEWTKKEYKNAVPDNQNHLSDEQIESLDPGGSRNEKRLFNKCNQSEESVVSSNPNDAGSHSSMPSSVISKRFYSQSDIAILPDDFGNEKRQFNKCDQSEEGVVHINPNDAGPHCFSMQSSIISKKLVPVQRPFNHNQCNQSKQCAVSSTPNDAMPKSSIQSSIFSKLLPPIQRPFNKCNESEKCVVSSTPNDAKPHSSMQSSTFGNALVGKSPEQSFGTKFKKKSNKHGSTHLQSEGVEHHLPRNHCIQSYYTEDKHLNSAGFGKSQHLLASSRKCSDMTDMEAPSLKPNITITEDAGNLERKLTSEPFAKGFGKELHMNELLVSKKRSVARVAKCDLSAYLPHNLFAHRPSVKNAIASSADDSIRTNQNHDNVVLSGPTKQTDINKMKADELVSDDHIRDGLDSPGEQGSKHNPASDFDENTNAIDEICLPDEDSLITSDDFKLPTDFKLSDRNLTETDLIASSSRMPGNIAHMLAALTIPLDERSRSSNEVPSFRLGSDDKKGSDTSLNNPNTPQHFSQSPHYQTNQQKTPIHPSRSRKMCGSKVKPSNSKNNSQNHAPLYSFPVQMVPNFFQDQHVVPTIFDIPDMLPFPEQILLPVELPYELNGLPISPPPPGMQPRMF